MKFYFLTDTPCALKIGGAYFGVVDTFEKFAEISLQDNLFAEFIPQCALPVCLFLNEKLLLSPPEKCEITFTKDGVILFIHDFIPTDYSLKICSQKRVNDVLITVFKQGEVQISLESTYGIYFLKLPSRFENSEIEIISNNVFVFTESEIQVFSLSGKKILERNCISHSFENGILTLESVVGYNRSIRTEKWVIDGESRFMSENGLTPDISGEFLAITFFERILYGGNYEEILTDELKPKAEKIKNFVGEFVSVEPYENKNCVALRHTRYARVYEYVYYMIETHEGKITDVKEL